LDRLDKIATWLELAKPASDIEDLAEKCSEDIEEVSVNQAESTISIAIKLHSVLRNVDYDISATIEGAEDSLNLYDEWDDESQKQWEDRRQIIERLLAPDSVIGLMSKVRELLYDFQSILMDSNVVTDIRQVYDKDATEVKAGLIVHTLSLEYFENSTQKEMHLMLSTTDVERLAKRLERALKKSKASASILKKSEVPELTPKRFI
ncbi:MAG: hypothetical protein V4671_08715, partial [Armatimonadota bacterium]